MIYLLNIVIFNCHVWLPKGSGSVVGFGETRLFSRHFCGENRENRENRVSNQKSTWWDLPNWWTSDFLRLFCHKGTTSDIPEFLAGLIMVSLLYLQLEHYYTSKCITGITIKKYLIAQIVSVDK